MNSTAPPETCRILCVEDEPDILRDVADELRAHGFTVDEAADAKIAYDKALATPPDLILCDLQMPGMSGIQLLEKLRSRADRLGTIPFLLVTAFGDRDHMIKGRKAGADDYLVKPIDYDLLVATISTHLGNTARRVHGGGALPGRQMPDRLSLRQALVAAEAPSELAVFSIDQPNDLIRQAGQSIERYLLGLLQAEAEERDFRCCHLDGFDFALLGPAGSLERILPRIGKMEHGERVSHQSPAPITTSIVTSPVLPKEDPDHLIDRLIEAAHLIQNAGGGRILSADAPEIALLRTARSLRGQILPAIARGEFHLSFQPRLRLSDRQVVGAEALLRWNSPEHGSVSPELTVSIAERAGIMRQVSDWVFMEIAAAQRMLASCGHDIRLGVNVGVDEFDDDLLPRLVNALEAHGATSDLLDIEITETLLAADIEKTRRVAQSLRDIGMTVAVDDFGTGYSSLSYLGQLPVDTVKVDRSFIEKLETDMTHRQIMASIVELTRSLGIESVAEGVETEAQCRALKEIGCDAIQGYVAAPPLALDQLIDYLDANRRPQAADQ